MSLLDGSNRYEKEKTVTDIVQFIKSRLDEDTKIAWDSINDCPEYATWAYQPWSREVKGSGEVVAPNVDTGDDWPVLVTHDAEGILNAVEETDGPHIARHDPARVLREVAAKRAIVASCSELIGHPSGDETTDLACEGYLRLLAGVYADHEDFDPKWGI